MTIQFGVSPMLWAHDNFPEFRHSLTAEQCLQEAYNAGFTAIELGCQFPAYPHQLNNLLKKHHFKLITGTITGQLLEQGFKNLNDKLDEVLPVLKSSGCEYVIYRDDSYSILTEQKSPLSVRPILNDVQWHEFIYKMNHLCEQVAEFGLKLVYAPHPASVVASLQDIEQFLAQVHPTIGLVMDVSYLLLESISPVCFYEQFNHRIAHIYCQDIYSAFYAEAKQKNQSYYDMVALNRFSGIDPASYSWKKLIQLLKMTQFQGWVVAKTEHNNSVSSQALAILAHDYLSAGLTNLELTS